MNISIPSHLSDTTLVGAVKHFARGERDASAQLVAHLAEFDARRLFAPAGFSSMFKYCCEVLRMSEDAAYNRIETARAAHRFPLILSALAAGTLNVTTVRLLARRLTPENHAALLAAASGLIEDLKRKKFAATDRPRPSRGVKPGSRGVPASVKRGTAQRDDERCGFVGTDGHRCGERAFLEFYHTEAFAGGGRATPGWVELRCRTHNAYEAELYFGGTMNLRSVQHGPDRARGAVNASGSSLSSSSTPARHDH